MKEYSANAEAARELKQRLLDEVLEYVGDDTNRTLLGVDAALHVGLDLVRATNMPDAMRLAFAQTFFHEMVDEIEFENQ